jgi:hypothetical protein
MPVIVPDKAYGVQRAPRGSHVLHAAQPGRFAGPTFLSPQEAVMPRGDEVNDELRFSDRDDDVDDLGYGGGGGGPPTTTTMKRTAAGRPTRTTATTSGTAPMTRTTTRRRGLAPRSSRAMTTRKRARSS